MYAVQYGVWVFKLIGCTEQEVQHQHVYLDREDLFVKLLSELRYQHSPGESFIRRVVAQVEVVIGRYCDVCSIRVVKLIELLEVSAVPVELTKE